MKFFLILFLTLFFYTPSFSENIKCEFEEVYMDSSIQKGFFLLKDNKLRYQYYDEKLFTLVYINQTLYFAKNNDYQNVEQYESAKTVIPTLFEIYKDFPNIQNTYNLNDYEINIEKNSKNNFIKRLGVKSNKVNLSIYFIDCQFKPINDLFFKVEPLFNY